MSARNPRSFKLRRFSLFQRTKAIILLLIGIGNVPFLAHAFPEMVRHGYGNCMSCHTSPTGGGILTDYGRQLISEVLSTWGREGEEQFAFGTTPSWLALGGDLRTLNFRQETSAGNQDRFFLMQGDLEAAVTFGEWTAVGTFGRLDSGLFPEGSQWISRRHFLQYRPDDEFSVRFGKFNRSYGINMADHFTTVKQGLQWDDQTETYALEGAWLSDRFNLYATADFGRMDQPKLDRERGVSGTASAFLAERHKVGVSYFYGSSDVANRNVFGPWALLGFTKQLFLLAELDFQRKYAFDFTDPQWGFASYSKLDFEPVRGVHVFGTAEASKLDFGDPSSRLLRYGVGAQFFPRPHFELEAAWQTQQALSMSEHFRKFLWLMLHYYL